MGPVFPGTPSARAVEVASHRLLGPSSIFANAGVGLHMQDTGVPCGLQKCEDSLGSCQLVRGISPMHLNE